MRQWQGQSRLRWYCKYHVVWVPKYRKKSIYGTLRRTIGGVIRELCRRHGVELVEGHALAGVRRAHDVVHFEPGILGVNPVQNQVDIGGLYTRKFKEANYRNSNISVRFE